MTARKTSTTKETAGAELMIARACVVTFLVGLLVFAALADRPIGSQTTIAPSVTVPHRIEEDESGWDCRKMGNKICGPGRKIAKGEVL